MKLKLFLTFLAAIFLLNIAAQTIEHSDKEIGNNEHPINEIGIANSLIYFLKEKVFAYGLHIHYLRSIPESKFGLGLGYERIFDKHKHNTIGFVVAYRPIDKFNLALSPGLAFEDNNSTVNFALHFETLYEFEIKDFHIGPLFDVAYDLEDFHLSLGLHLGYGF